MTRVLARLGVFGYERIEPAILAALATEKPLLLVGAHGTAKSLLLERLAAALGLEHRHYNASLLNFDDLVGYPYPTEDRSELRYVQTPGTIWGAQSVFLDEISRCRPELQNKLFPIVHECRVQGLKLPHLRHRWAAMNPPSLEEDDAYRGSEPLDAALADRFPFVVEVPALQDLDDDAQRAVISGRGADADSSDAVRAALLDVRAGIDSLRAAHGPRLVEWVRALAPLLATAKAAISPRRASMLFEATLAVHAAQPGAQLGDSAFLALRCGLPHIASGKALNVTLLLGAHRQAWAITEPAIASSESEILREPDAVCRVAIALRCGSASASTYLLDAWAGLAPWEQQTFAAALFPIARERCDLTAVAFDALAAAYAPLEDERERRQMLTRHGPQYARWKDATTEIARLPRTEPVLRNLLYVLSEQNVAFDAATVAARYFAWRRLFSEAGVPRAA